jgi:tetratricopeptide (TPR) repeat protein
MPGYDPFATLIARARSLLGGRDDPARLERALREALANPDLDSTALSALSALAERAERAFGDSPTPRQLLTLGRAREAIATGLIAWEQRPPALARALAHYERAAAIGPPGDAVALEAAWHAGCLLAGEHHVRAPARAIPYLERVIAWVNGYHPAYYYLGEAHVLLKDFDAAERALRAGLALDPSQEGILRVLRYLPLDRANEAVKAGDWARARSALEGAPILAESADATGLLGDALIELGELDGARRAWEQAISLEPGRRAMRHRFRRLGLERPGATTTED